jgi:hypothetical protein
MAIWRIRLVKRGLVYTGWVERVGCLREILRAPEVIL